jgi:hypothetical protein
MSNKAKEKVEAAPIAQPITLESNISKCAFSISYSGLKDNPKMAELFLGYHLWHKVQSLMFAGGKKAKFTKESPYSPELAAHALAKAQDELGLFFDGLTIKISEEIKDSEEQKFMKFCKGLGMSEEAAKAGWTTAQAAKPAVVEAKVEEKVLE